MSGALNNFGRQRILKEFADWTDRIAGGEVPPAPPRPQGIERNVVITQWDWADPKAYLHDEVSTDRRNPTVNANGPALRRAGIRARTIFPCSIRCSNVASRVELTVRDPNTQPAQPATMPAPSPYWGNEVIWDSKNNVHNPMFDETGPGLDHVGRSPAGEPGVLQRGVEPSVREAVPDCQRRPAPRGLGSENQAADAHQHLLRHAPPDVRRGRQPHALDAAAAVRSSAG